MVSHSQAAAAYEDDLDFSDSPVHSVVEMSQRPTGLGPGELKIAGYNNQQLDSHFPESPRSSRLGSFMGNDPKFESPGASSASEELVDAQQQKPLVTVVWRNLNIAIKHIWFSEPKVLLKQLSGYAEPRSILAIVGPSDSGKSVLLGAIANRIYRPAQAGGEVLVNGMRLKSSSIEPTYLAADDELLWGLTVEQTLTYTGELQLQGSGRAGWRETAHTVSESLGLLAEMHKPAYDLPLGTRRRVAVACQLINASPLLILHDVLDGIQEGDALAIMRCLQDFCREGCTAIMCVQQPTTDICSFFNKAYVLCNGELVYFGNTANEALSLLSSSGMPCPPLYSPVEQYMRLIDPSFEVYLQVSQAQLTDLNARFSSMMFKVLQDSYENSQLGKDQQSRTETLATASYDAHLQTSWVAHNSSLRHFPILCRRIIAQALRCISVYVGRILIALILSIIYGCTYVHLNTTDDGWYQRSTIFFLVCAVVPFFSITCLPVYDNLTKVALREHSRCKVSIFTYLLAKLAVDIPHLVMEVVVMAIILIPTVKLNTSGNGWGYFILVVFLNQMAADAMISAVTAFFHNRQVQDFVALVLFGIQFLAMGFFPGAERGFNLVVGTVAFPHYAYTGLIKNEAESHDDWSCPFANTLYQGIVPADSCRLTSRQLYQIYRLGFGVTFHSKWANAGIVAAIWVFWILMFLAGLTYRIKFPRVKTSPRRY